MKRTIRRPSPAIIVGVIALIAALSGTATALPGVNLIDSGDIKNGQVKRNDIAKNAVNGAKVADGSLTPSDFSGSVQGPPGPQGPKGDKGDTGATGDTGPAGRSPLSPLQSGETVRGVIGQRETEADGEVGSSASLPIPAPVALDDQHVTVDGSIDEVSNTCTGTAAAPTAPAGHVCIYPYYTQNVAAAEGPEGYVWGAFDGNSKWGFQMGWYTTAAGDTAVFATWAYTA